MKLSEFPDNELLVTNPPIGGESTMKSGAGMSTFSVAAAQSATDDAQPNLAVYVSDPSAATIVTHGSSETCTLALPAAKASPVAASRAAVKRPPVANFRFMPIESAADRWQ